MVQNIYSGPLCKNHRKEKNPYLGYAYVVNLDPAVMTLSFGANIDIRDTVRYTDVKKEYGLDPNK
ncbi:hypothetical protein C2845_PM13G12280 [Panicum miliaceum]|uniref:GPN-loop GTPase n=1 Tax=Panicum miliaceum TaxID=4540 RepID=A0A3L6RL78_PANMI|nr:hypothetical protein C2845_PM13G12280 [Panicum miliaceum]